MTRKSFGLSSFGHGLEDKGPTDLLVACLHQDSLKDFGTFIFTLTAVSFS